MAAISAVYNARSLLSFEECAERAAKACKGRDIALRAPAFESRGYSVQAVIHGGNSGGGEFMAQVRLNSGGDSLEELSDHEWFSLVSEMAAAASGKHENWSLPVAEKVEEICS